jgi:hypothetical protein
MSQCTKRCSLVRECIVRVQMRTVVRPKGRMSLLLVYCEQNVWASQLLKNDLPTYLPTYVTIASAAMSRRTYAVPMLYAVQYVM